MVRATFIYIFIAIYVLILAPPAMLWTFLFKDTRIIYILARFCIRTSGVLAGIRVRCEGVDNILPGQTYLFLSNHQGNFDGPVLCHAIPRNWKALIKQEMMRLPVLSLVLRQVQFVPIERTNPQRARLSIDHGAELLASGNSFIAFPEGTRSRSGTLGPFKKGAFLMAIKSQIPVMPVTILGSAAVQPPGSYAVRPGKIRVIFHDSISTEGMNIGDRDRLIEQTRKAIASKLPI
ncbi:MAG: lysophospholipid acyltransferase family protein [Acidobacteriota bacterium]